MKILFVGDSITDCDGYKKNVFEHGGYVKFTAQLLGDEHEYFNHGISGDTAQLVLNRYDDDVKAINPDVMTLLIGINDVWRAFDRATFTSPEQYSRNVREILTRFKKDCPNAKIIILEPFLLPHPDKKYFRPLLAGMIEEIRTIATEFADEFIPLDGLLAAERMNTPWEELSQDGVHPAEKGQKFIANILADKIRKVMED